MASKDPKASPRKAEPKKEEPKQISVKAPEKVVVKAVEKKEEPKKAPKPVVQVAGEPVKAPEKKEEKRPKYYVGPSSDMRVHYGNFVRVVAGKHQGRYGVLDAINEDLDLGVLRTRDDDSARLEVHLSDLRPDRSGRR